MFMRILAGTGTLAAALVLGACGGSDSSDAPPSASTNTLSGTAAVGAPIVGGTVSVSCAGGGTLSTSTSSMGLWSVTTSGQTLPCAVQVSGGTIGVNGSVNSTPYHSIAVTFGTINITPLTDLIVANLTGTVPGIWFEGLKTSPSGLKDISATVVSSALGNVSTTLGMSTTLGSANPLTTEFSATSGNKYDDILEALAAAGSTHANLLSMAIQTVFNAPAGFNFATAYAAVVAANAPSTGGGGTTACASGETALTYSGSGPYTNGQKVCFTASPTALTFSGKTLGNPTVNTVVQAPYAAYAFSDSGYSYEVVLNNGALYEINVSSSGQFLGQFAAASVTVPNPPATGTAALTVTYNVSGILAGSFEITNVPVPGSESDFCGWLESDATYQQIKSQSGGTFTVNSCSFVNNKGTLSATVSSSGITIPYSVIYQYH